MTSSDEITVLQAFDAVHLMLERLLAGQQEKSNDTDEHWLLRSLMVGTWRPPSVGLQPLDRDLWDQWVSSVEEVIARGHDR